MPKLNILHHKAFHVLNKDNVERVQKDEAIERAKERREEERQKRIEGERRLNLLRSKKGVNDQSKETHVNLFEYEEKLRSGNEERERIERIEKEKMERKMTSWHLDTGLKDVPWYQDKNESVGKVSNHKDAKLKHRYDPMRIIEKNHQPQAIVKKPMEKLSKLEKLRQEKAQRERDERERKQKLLKK